MSIEKSSTKHIEVVSYDPHWPEMFSTEETIIRTALSDNCVAIHHVGSTAVPGLAAKPKIDIIAVAKVRKQAIIDLGKAGYAHRGEWNIPLKCGFNKRGTVNVNLHLFFDENHSEVELNLKFRDYLRAHPNVRDEYAALKIKILEDETSQQILGNFPIYTIRKRNFIDNIVKETGFNRLRILKCTTESEWSAAENFRKKHPTQVINTGPNHEHFIFYRGVEIIGYADIHIVSESEVELVVFENSDREAISYFSGVIEEWMNVHGYKSVSRDFQK